LGPSDRCLGLMPLFHIHGLIGVLLASLAAGGSVHCGAGLGTRELLPTLQRSRATWYSAVPTMHRAIVDAARSVAPTTAEHELRFIRSSSAPLPASLFEQLEA